MLRPNRPVCRHNCKVALYLTCTQSYQRKVAVGRRRYEPLRRAPTWHAPNLGNPIVRERGVRERNYFSVHQQKHTRFSGLHGPKGRSPLVVPGAGNPKGLFDAVRVKRTAAWRRGNSDDGHPVSVRNRVGPPVCFAQHGWHHRHGPNSGRPVWIWRNGGAFASARGKARARRKTLRLRCTGGRRRGRALPCHANPHRSRRQHIWRHHVIPRH